VAILVETISQPGTECTVVSSIFCDCWQQLETTASTLLSCPNDPTDVIY